MQRLLATQQAVMAALGFYDGEIDGSWGPKAVAAMRLWEMEESFDPALPTRGYPMAYPARLPKGLSWASGPVPKISYVLLSPALRAEVDKHMATFNPLTSSAIDEGLEPKPVAVKAEAPAPAPTQQNNVQQNNVQQQGQKHQQNQQRKKRYKGA